MVAYSVKQTPEDAFGYVDLPGTKPCALVEVFYANIDLHDIHRFKLSENVAERKAEILKAVNWIHTRGIDNLLLVGTNVERFLTLLFHEAVYHGMPASWLLTRNMLDVESYRNSRYSSWKTQLEAYGFSQLPAGWDGFGNHVANDSYVLANIAKAFGTG